MTMLCVDHRKELIKTILENPIGFDWSLQGMGMLRLYMVKGNLRLHIWDSSFRFPKVSMIHNHLQWGLKSTIISGVVINRRYSVTDVDTEDKASHKRGLINAGIGGGLTNEIDLVSLYPLSPERYEAADSYAQLPDEVHETDAVDGTVTLMEKFSEATNQAEVFWPIGTDWGTALPRKATNAEILCITQRALDVWS